MTTHYSNNRIAIVSSSCPPLGGGGISSAHYNLYKALKNRGYEVKIFTYGDHVTKQKEEKDIIRHGTPLLFVKIVRFTIWLYFKILERTKVAYQFADILASAIGSIKINKSLKRFHPAILILPDHDCPGFFIKKGKKCTTVLISHHNPMRFINEPLWGNPSEIDARLALKIENSSLKKVDKVICPSSYMADVFRKTYLFDGPISVIPNVVDEKLISSILPKDVRKDFGLPEDSVLIYIPSAGSIFKGSSYVFEIIRRLAAYSQKGIGFYLSGDINEELKRELCFLPDNAKVYMPGHLSFQENISVVKGCSFGVSPTLIESFGMAILEANLCGLPVISFDVGGNAEVIYNNENGFLVPFLDLEKLINYSEKLLDNVFREKMRAKTVKFAYDKFNTENILNKFLAFIGEYPFDPNNKKSS